MKTGWKVLGAACVVQIAVAACSSAATHIAETYREGGTDEDAGIVGKVLQEAAAILDAVGGVDTAAAGPLPDEVATETCSTASSFDAGSGVQYVFAEHAFPGRSENDLSAVRVIVHFAAGASYASPLGYNAIVATPWIQQGKVAYFCGASAQASQIDSVTFLLPGK